MLVRQAFSYSSVGTRFEVEMTNATAAGNGLGTDAEKSASIIFYRLLGTTTTAGEGKVTREGRKETMHISSPHGGET